MPEQDYPDLNLAEGVEEAMAQFLFTELSDSILARSSMELIWEQILRLYEQLNVPEKKDKPFVGAADIMIPIIATYCEQIHARLHGTIYEPADPYVCAPTRDDLLPYAKAIKKWLKWADANELNSEVVDYSAFMQLLQLGTMVEKVVYERQDRTLYKYNKPLKKYEPVVERMKDNPEFVHISLNDFFWQMHARNIEESEWRAHRYRISWNEVKLRVQDGRFRKEDVEHIRNWYSTQSNDMHSGVQIEIGIEPTAFYEFEFWEVWYRYPIKFKVDESAPIDESGNIQNAISDIPVMLKADFHKDARTFVSLDHNTFPLGLDPFEVCPFVGRVQQVVGIGVGQMSLPFHIEVTAMHNQRLDSGTVVNAPAYKYKADSRVPSALALSPGGGIPVDEMEDMEPFHLGTKADSTLEAEAATLALLQERIGVRELALDDMALSKAPATTTLAILQEKGRRLDNVLRNIRRFKKRLILKAILLYQAYYPKEKLLDILGPADGALVAKALLELSPQTIWDGMGIEVAATTSATSREMERQNKMALFNALLGYNDKYLGYVTAALNPQAPPPLADLLIRMGEGLRLFTADLMAAYGEANRNEYVVGVQSEASQAQPGAGSAPDAGAQQAVQQPGVASAQQNGGPANAPPAAAPRY